MQPTRTSGTQPVDEGFFITLPDDLIAIVLTATSQTRRLASILCAACRLGPGASHKLSIPGEGVTRR
jgi:hypothetical protein